MNYRHAYHAGGFADVVKHAVLARILTHLRDKPAPFRVIDTHAGAGIYDLAAPEAGKTAEWRDGIARLQAAALGPAPRTLLAPYFEAVAARNPGRALAVYPGSPAIAQTLLRPQDRLVACELEPGAAAALARLLRGDPRTRALAIDGWSALNAQLPPKERRGVVLIDPPFEQPGEFSRLVQGLQTAHRKWATGVFLLWYPIKDAAETTAFTRRIARLGIAKTLRAELTATSATDATGLRGSGLIVVNPPWLLADELKVLLPALVTALGRDARAAHTLDWLVGETSRRA